MSTTPLRRSARKLRPVRSFTPGEASFQDGIPDGLLTSSYTSSDRASSDRASCDTTFARYPSGDRTKNGRQGAATTIHTSLPAAPAAAASAFTLASFLRLMVQASRPGLWQVTVWCYLLPIPGRWDLLFAADPFEASPELWRCWVGFVYCLLPLNLLVYGWNDLVDAETDGMNPRKGGMLFGGRPSAAERRVLPRLIAAAQAPFVLAFAAWCGVAWTGAWLAAVVGVNYAYNNLALSSRCPWDLGTPFGYLLVVVLSVKLNEVEVLPVRALLHTAFFIMRTQIWAQTMDYAADSNAGRPTTAVVLGARNSRLLLIAVLAAETGFVYTQFDDAYLLLFSAVSLANAVVELWVNGAGPSRRGSVLSTCALLGVLGIGLVVHVWRTKALTRGVGVGSEGGA
jgi:4-hydroxybenzoate polyprenyltransferase